MLASLSVDLRLANGEKRGNEAARTEPRIMQRCGGRLQGRIQAEMIPRARRCVRRERNSMTQGQLAAFGTALLGCSNHSGGFVGQSSVFAEHVAGSSCCGLRG